MSTLEAAPGAARAVSAASWRLLLAALVAQVGFSVVDQGVPTLTGFVKGDLRTSAAMAGLAVSSFPFGKVFGSYAAGIAADRVGERRVIMAGGIAVAALVAAAMASPVPLLFVLLFAAGVASASSTPAGGRLVLSAFSDRQAFALGIRQTGIPAGGLIAAALLPWVADVLSWRWSLAVAGALTLVAIVPVARTRVDPTRAVAPPRRRDLLWPARNRQIRLVTVWGCLLVTGQYAILAYLALDLHRSLGLSLAGASALVVVAQAAGILGRVVWGLASDRAGVSSRAPFVVALTVFGLLSALLLFATPRSAPVAVFAVVAALAGLALLGFQGLWVALIAEAAGPERVGAATGFAVTFTLIAGTAATPLYGLAADVAGTYRAVWAALAVVAAVALVPALGLARARR